MEITLAIVVATAVIFFGALISAGNERQRKAIDELREQIALWAMQDLRIKCEQLARDVRIDDPLSWFNKVVSKIMGNDLLLQVVESFDDPPALECDATNGFAKLIFTPVHPSQIIRMSRERHDRLSQYGKRNPLFLLPKKARFYELSILNSGILFDLELSLAWKGVTGNPIVQTDRLWVYKIASEQ